MALRIKIGELADAVLYRLYVRATMNPSSAASLDDLVKDDFGGAFGRKILDMALTSLVNNSWVEKIQNEDDGELYYEITYSGFERVSEAVENEFEFIARYADDSNILSASAIGIPERRPIPAADRFVAIDHNSPDIARLEAGIEATIEEIRQRNDLTEDDEIVAAQLRASLDLIAAPRVSAELLERMLFGSLRYFGERFANTAVSMAAGAALTLAIQLFGFN